MIDLVPPFQGLNTRITAQMMTAQNAVNDGEWVDFARISIWSIHVKDVSGGDIVQVRASNALIEPDASEHGFPVGINIKDEQGVSSSSHRFRWVKVRKFSGTASSPNAYLFADWRLFDR